MLSGLELLAALAIVFVGATVMGTVTFGFGLVVAPVLLLLVDPQSAVIIINSLIPILMLFILFNTRRHFNPRLVGAMAVGGLAAAPIGVLALDAASPTTLRISVALLILALVPLVLLNLRLPLSQHPLPALAIGFLTSLSVTTLSIGGPLATIYVVTQRHPPQVIRASLAFYFLLYHVAAICLYALTGLVHRDTVANIGILLPGVVVGFALATQVSRGMNERAFRFVAGTVIIGGGAALLVREILRL